MGDKAMMTMKKAGAPILEGKHAVVFGAGGSIGAAVAREFAAEGAEVFLGRADDIERGRNRQTDHRGRRQSSAGSDRHSR